MFYREWIKYGGFFIEVNVFGDKNDRLEIWRSYYLILFF